MPRQTSSARVRSSANPAKIDKLQRLAIQVAQPGQVLRRPAIRRQGPFICGERSGQKRRLSRERVSAKSATRPCRRAQKKQPHADSVRRPRHPAPLARLLRNLLPFMTWTIGPRGGPPTTMPARPPLGWRTRLPCSSAGHHGLPRLDRCSRPSYQKHIVVLGNIASSFPRS